MATPRLIDLTRLVSRLGREALTGVDRVELAWLNHLLEREGPDGASLFALVRNAWGFALLEKRGAQQIAYLAVSAQADLPPPDLIGRLSRRRDPLRARAETLVRRLAVARCTVPGLARMIGRAFPAGVNYVNTGHANLTPRVMAAMPGKVAVLIHDTIPLDHPEFTRPGIPVVFERKLAAAGARADYLIYSSRSARDLAEVHLRRLGRVPPGVIAPLGITPPQMQPAPLPASLDPTRPWFVCLGTIEPRKNHAVLLDAWQLMTRHTTPERMPQLVIAGSRGWNNAAVFHRLDARPPHVTEARGLSDASVTALLSGARGLLFPSHAEGFGLPALEAAALGVPLFLSDLAVFHELLGAAATYLAPNDPAAWATAIELAADPSRAKSGESHHEKEENKSAVRLPTWDEHFNAALSSL